MVQKSKNRTRKEVVKESKDKTPISALSTSLWSTYKKRATREREKIMFIPNFNQN